MVIQNYDSIFLDFSSIKREAYFPAERFSKDRVVDYMFINPNFNGLDGEAGLVFPPAMTPNGSDLLTLVTDDFSSHMDFGMFLSVFDADKCKVFDSMPISQFVCRQNSGVIPVGTAIDPSLSRINIYPSASDIPNFQGVAQLNVGVIYCNTAKNPTSAIFKKRSFRVNFPADTFKVNLCEFTNYALRDKEIKKIIIRGDYYHDMDDNTDYVPTDKWITLRTTNARDIYQIPSGFLCDLVRFDNGDFCTPRQLDDVYFDDLRIDEDNSYIENPTGTAFKGEITFYY